jgi:Tol biopolymer transport system component
MTRYTLFTIAAMIALSALLTACDTPALAQGPEVQATIVVDKATPSPGPTRTPEPVSTLSPERALELSELGWIAFTASEGGRRDVWLIKPDGTGQYNLTGTLDNTFAEAPVWSPDASTIAFDGLPNSDVERDIYMVTVDPNPEQWAITNQPDFDCYPSFSPDGQRIIYMAEHEGNRDLFIMDVDGTNIVQLTDDPTYDYEPAWSPDGERIAFISRRSGNSELYVMDIDGSNMVQLTDDAKLDWRPAWSPDGEWIAFESWRTGNGDIYIIRPDGSDLQRLTFSGAEDGHPHFSPDGRYLVFHSQRTGNYQLFILEFDDPENQWLLETGSVRSLLPVWSPVVEVPGAGYVEGAEDSDG